jgi:hypothetical protein
LPFPQGNSTVPLLPKAVGGLKVQGG